MNNDNNMVNNLNQGVGSNSPIIPQNIQMGNNQNQSFQSNVNNSSMEEDTNYSPAVSVPGLDELEDYVDENATNTVINNSNTANSNLNSNNLNPSTSVNSNQGNVGETSNISNQPQIDMAVIDESFDDNSKNFSPNIDVTNLTSAQDLGNDEVFNPIQELGVDANNFNNPNNQFQSKPVDFGFDPFNKFDETTEENFLPGFDQYFYNPDYDDSTNFMPGIVPENDISSTSPVADETTFIPNETVEVQDINDIMDSVQPVPSNNITNTNNVTVEPVMPNISTAEPTNDFVQPTQYKAVQRHTVNPSNPTTSGEPVIDVDTTLIDNNVAAEPLQDIPVVEPNNSFVAPEQPSTEIPVMESQNEFAVPTQQMPYTAQVQQAENTFVPPVQPFAQPSIPTQPAMEQVQNISPINPNNEIVEDNFGGANIPQQPMMSEPIQQAPVANPTEVPASDDLVNSIDSLDDFSKTNIPVDNNNFGEDILQPFNMSQTASVTPPSGYPSTPPDDIRRKMDYSAMSVDSIRPKINYSMSNFNSLLTPDKKIVTFIGASKNGTSFLVNNLATIFSSVGINTAILDMTHNRNSYYIYTKCDENLRKVSYTSIEKLKVGESEGIKVNKNLTVYTALPNDGKQYDECEEILTTLAQNHSLVLIDCDFTTPMGYFALCQEIYLVQTLDILTIQPLTAFLRDLKSNNVLEPEKVRVVINKDLKVGKLTSKVVISGMSSYNDPSMSFMTELFNKDTVNYCVIPFDERAYSKYLEGVVNCEISVNGFSSGFVNRLKTLAEMIYPLKSKQAFGKNNQNSVQPMQPQNTFSQNTNNTLNKMKNNM